MPDTEIIDRHLIQLPTGHEYRKYFTCTHHVTESEHGFICCDKPAKFLDTPEGWSPDMDGSGQAFCDDHCPEGLTITRVKTNWTMPGFPVI